MASVKVDKPVGTQPFGQAKKEPAVKSSDGAYKGPASRQPPRRLPQRPLLNLRRRQNRVVEGLIPGSCKIQKRGCSSSSSLSSVLQNYRFKRAISVGKPRGSRSSTPVPSWRTMAAALDSPKYAPSQSGGGRSRPVSTRKLAATLWEMNEAPSPRVGDNLEEKKAVKREMRVRERMGVPRSVHSGSLPPHLSDPSHSPISELRAFKLIIFMKLRYLPKLRQWRASPKRIEGPDGRNLQLHFRSRLSLPLFTGGKVEGEQGAAIHIVLLDVNTGHVVTSGPESTIKLDVVVLEGDFNNEDDEGWTEEEFESHVVKEREGKRPLLTGDLQVTLKEGVGTLGELTFTDNSSWIRSRKFRLGLKVASGFCEGIRVVCDDTYREVVLDPTNELLVCTISGHCFDRFLSPIEMEPDTVREISSSLHFCFSS
ncbi:hypothetical protein TEA_021417 [Camellia sinensis var. sinensis]|uniref:Calmodulin binding protein-like N-terminal domain-containing protein n=1 Tax=Camellia sinensis var. sinensis TaxID=542762 RepID=A0A4S4DUI6_CAMSN|nr:hypothetical protein TEA_021417 [Camellia sinensis var. sinensis]